MLMIHLNLETVIKPKVLEELIALMDVDGDDHIRYNEFARICAPGAAGDLFHVSSEDREMLAVKKAEVKKPKLTKAQKRKLMKREMGFS